jgi:hypothetical protein
MKNKTQMRADLRLDLKDASTTWADAELDRCIDRAVADLSRFLPAEKLYEETLSFTITDEAVTMPADTDADKIVDGMDIGSSSAGDTCTIAAQPDVARPVTFTITDANASITILSLIVKGVDENGHSIIEYLHFGGGGSKTGTGKQYFKYIHEIEIDQISGNGASDVLDIGIGAYTDVWVTLANKQIEDASETLDDGSGTAYIRDTDFRIDYARGRIKAISGGDISAADSLEIDYTKSKISIDLSSLHNFTRLDRVLYPAGEVPQEFASADFFGNVMTVTSTSDGSQAEMSEKEHIVVRYFANYDPPTDNAPGSYPKVLEQTVETAAGAYALFMIALKYEHQMAADLVLGDAELAGGDTSLTSAGTNLESAGTELGLTTAIHALADAAFDKASTYGANAVTALNSASSAAALGTIALGKVATYLENNSNEDSKGWLTKITTDVAELRTKIIVAQDAMASYLSEVDTTDLAGAEAIWDTSQKSSVIAGTLPNMTDYLTTGDDTINTINVGDNVPELRRDYSAAAERISNAWANRRQDFLTAADRRISAALGYATEISQRLSNLRSYIEQADGWGKIASGFVDEAAQRVAVAQAYVADAASQVSISDMYIAEGQARVNEIHTHILEAGTFKDIAGIYRSMAEMQYNNSASYQNAASQYRQLADRFRSEAIERRNEVWAIWRDPKGYVGELSAVMNRQPTQYSRSW